jgi:hypothetical protein
MLAEGDLVRVNDEGTVYIGIFRGMEGIFAKVEKYGSMWIHYESLTSLTKV